MSRFLTKNELDAKFQALDEKCKVQDAELIRELGVPTWYPRFFDSSKPTPTFEELEVKREMLETEFRRQEVQMQQHKLEEKNGVSHQTVTAGKK